MFHLFYFTYSTVYDTWLKMFTTSSNLIMGYKRLVNIFKLCPSCWELREHLNTARHCSSTSHKFYYECSQ